MDRRGVGVHDPRRTRNAGRSAGMVRSPRDLAANAYDAQCDEALYEDESAIRLPRSRTTRIPRAAAMLPGSAAIMPGLCGSGALGRTAVALPQLRRVDQSIPRRY